MEALFSSRREIALAAGSRISSSVPVSSMLRILRAGSVVPSGLGLRVEARVQEAAYQGEEMMMQRRLAVSLTAEGED